MANILVLGGTGFVGRHVCEKLVALGHTVTVPTRRTSNAQSVQTLPTLTVLQADIHDAAQLKSLVRGHEAVVNLVAILHGDQSDFERTHVALPRSIATACTGAGVSRLVQVSAIGADVHGPSMYQRSKGAGEAVLLAETATSPTQLAIVRPSVVFGEGDALLNLFAKLQAIFPFVPLAGAETRFQPVWVEDLADLLVKLALCPISTVLYSYVNNSKPVAANQARIVEAVGPDVLTLKQIVQLAGSLSGHPRPVFGLPAPLAKAQAFLMELAPGQPLMSRDNLASMQTPNVASGALPGLQDCGITPAHLAAIAPTYLGGNGPLERLDELRRFTKR